MLTGLITPTSGDMIVNGLDFKKDMTEIRKFLGV
jgi:ABC-type multidrug transport system ATPase subunit